MIFMSLVFLTSITLVFRDVLAGSISGTVSYSGSQTGTIYAAVFTAPPSCSGSISQNPFSSLQVPSGSYAISGLPDGAYYLVSVMITDSQYGCCKPTDPWGIYNGCTAITPININSGNAVIGKDITLVDGTVANPNPFYAEEVAYQLTVSGDANGTINFVKTISELWYTGVDIWGGGSVYVILPFATHSPPLANLPPQVGQSWNSTGDSNGYTVNSTATVKSVTQTITTPAGTFLNCAYVEENLSYPNGYTPGQPQPPLKYERWFCPGIGPVKVIITDSSTHTGELISYSNINAAPTDYFPLGLQFSWTFQMDSGYYAGQTTWVVTSAVSNPATVTTTATSDITSTTATGGGIVTSEGGTSVIARGVCWSKSQAPSLNDSCTSDGMGPGAFVSSITGLSAGTTYHVRAYATNNGGTAYGNDLSFFTNCASSGARVGTGTYGTLQAAANAAATIGGSLIMANAASFTEPSVVISPSLGGMTLYGGYDCIFLTVQGMTTLIGSMTVQGLGSITIENVAIR